MQKGKEKVRKRVKKISPVYTEGQKVSHCNSMSKVWKREERDDLYNLNVMVIQFQLAE